MNLTQRCFQVSNGRTLNRGKCIQFPLASKWRRLNEAKLFHHVQCCTHSCTIGFQLHPFFKKIWCISSISLTLLALGKDENRDGIGGKRKCGNGKKTGDWWNKMWVSHSQHELPGNFRGRKGRRERLQKFLKVPQKRICTPSTSSQFCSFLQSLV